jgi:hypothetical protein
MFNRKFVLPVMLATAVGAPYLLTSEDGPSALTQQITGMFSGSGTGDASSDAPWTATGTSRDVRSEYGYGAAAQHPHLASAEWLAGAPVRELREVIRFDIPPSWVTGRWPRVTTTLSETGLEGLRVPLVTGTQIDDLAGSLTYYVDHQHRVQRLTFEGFTGDDRRLVALATQDYGLQPQATLHAGMYAAWWNAAPTSILRVARAPVVSVASPHAQLQVFLELNRPGMQYGLSPAAHEILLRDRSSWRW